MKIQDIGRGAIFASVTTLVLFAIYSGAMIVITLLGFEVGIPVALFAGVFAIVLYLGTAFYAARRQYDKAVEAEKAKQFDAELLRLLNDKYNH
jgi:hypothetical protein